MSVRLSLLGVVLLIPGVVVSAPVADDKKPKVAVAPALSDILEGRFSWTCSPPLIAPVERPEDPYHAIKDPTVVHFEGRWHVYATIKCRDRTVMEHLSFEDWKDADAAPRKPIELVKAYHCAPQVLYFRPQRKWYLIYQWGDDSRKYFGPCYSTMEHPGKPETLTKPVMLYSEKPENLEGWLDFWVIGDPDTRKVHLFFTSLDGRMWRADTRYADFPHGWCEPVLALRGDIFEASHTYRIRGTGKFLTIVEAQASGRRRYYKAYVADRLDGQWTAVAGTLEKPFAGERNVRFPDGIGPWTDSFSHGELLREGHDETMTVDPKRLRLLFQGCSKAGREGKGYGGFPWRLGLLQADGG